MGIGKFFRTFAERYPTCISPYSGAQSTSSPPVSNLCLDANGLIHNCTHPGDFDATKRAPTEKEMVQAMFNYIEKLFNAVQPRKYFLIAVDGCAPRAKMNQQRQRRYRAGFEMMKAREEALKVGEELPDEGDVFDSNSITPGTEFMSRLTEHFEYFIAMKIQNDSSWRNCTVIFSGQNDPGEGEHKIVDFIRRRKMQPDYEPNETHCMYGLDADLVMLALATHEPHFLLLREVVAFGPKGTKREQERHAEDKEKGIVEDPTLMKADSFVLLHMNLFREYLDMDIRRGDDSFPNYDMERVMDDFVLMCFMIGNDFLPALPTLHIGDGAINTLFNIYRSHIVSKGYNLCDAKKGKINWAAMEVMLQHVGALELETLRQIREEELEFQKRAATRGGDSGVVAVPPVPITNMADYKRHFYGTKHGFGSFDPSGPEMSALRLHYLEGLSWVFEYYYQGPPSWKWYYPHHYAPLASDLVMLAATADKIKFERGEPFLPHQQLLAVLPPSSHRSLPKAYWPLLLSPGSPLHKWFPKELLIDREGARAPWEGTVLIPFMEESELIAAYNSVQQNTTELDRQRNRNMKPLLFKYDNTVVPYDVPSGMFETLNKITVRRSTISFPEIPAATNGRFVPALCPGVKIGKELMEGFSSLAAFVLNGMTLQPVLEPNVVNIFGMTSKKDSLVMHVEETPSSLGASGDASRLAHLVGKNVWVGIPHLKRARVSSVVDRRQRVSAKFNDEGVCVGVVSQDINNDEFRSFRREADTHVDMLKSKCGIVLRSVDILVFVNRFTGLKLSRRGKFVQQFSNKETCYPVQLVADAAHLPVTEDPKNMERDRVPIDAETGTRALYIGPDPPGHTGARPLLGSPGWAKLSQDRKSFDMAVQYRPTAPTVPERILDVVRSDNWLSIGQVCHRISARLRFNVSPGTLTQLASSIITSPAYGGHELGLCIKFTGKNLARVGYTRLQQTEYNAWYVGGGAALFERMEDNTDDGYYMREDSGIGGGTQRNQRGGGGGNTGRNDKGEQRSQNSSGKGIWQFSMKALDLLTEYCERFTPLVERLEQAKTNSINFDVSTVLRGPWANKDAGEVVRDITSWLEQKGIAKMQMMNASEEVVPSEMFAELETAVASWYSSTAATSPTTKASAAAAAAAANNSNSSGVLQTLHMSHVQQRFVHFPMAQVTSTFSVAVPLPKEQKVTLLSRVVYCRTSGNVPFGLSGTVTRLLADNTTVEVVFDETFVGGVTFGGRLKANRGALVPIAAVLVTASPDVNTKSSRAGASPATSAATSDNSTGGGGGGINVAAILDKLNLRNEVRDERLENINKSAAFPMPVPRSNKGPASPASAVATAASETRAAAIAETVLSPQVAPTLERGVAEIAAANLAKQQASMGITPAAAGATSSAGGVKVLRLPAPTKNVTTVQVRPNLTLLRFDTTSNNKKDQDIAKMIQSRVQGVLAEIFGAPAGAAALDSGAAAAANAGPKRVQLKRN